MPCLSLAISVASSVTPVERDTCNTRRVALDGLARYPRLTGKAPTKISLRLSTVVRKSSLLLKLLQQDLVLNIQILAGALIRGFPDSISYLMRHLGVCRASSVSLLLPLQLSVENLSSLLHVVEVTQSANEEAARQHAQQDVHKTPDRSVAAWRLASKSALPGYLDFLHSVCLLSPLSRDLLRFRRPACSLEGAIAARQ